MASMSPTMRPAAGSKTSMPNVVRASAGERTTESTTAASPLGTGAADRCTIGAQPTSTLATTGADTSAPLTAGLLALGAGAALTLAGRRRREAQNS